MLKKSFEGFGPIVALDYCFTDSILVDRFRNAIECGLKVVLLVGKRMFNQFAESGYLASTSLVSEGQLFELDG